MDMLQKVLYFPGLQFQAKGVAPLGLPILFEKRREELICWNAYRLWSVRFDTKAGAGGWLATKMHLSTEPCCTPHYNTPFFKQAWTPLS
jgi:hypothetical protein